MRSEKASGRLYVTSKGVTTIESTPATQAEKVSVWLRSRFTCASYMVWLKREVVAHTIILALSRHAGLYCSTICAHSIRAARNFAISIKKLDRNAHIELNARSNFFGLATGISKQVHQAVPHARAYPEFLIDVCAGICENTAVNGDAPQAGNGSHNVEKSGGLGGKSSGIHAFYSVTELATQRIIVNRARRSLGTLLP